MGEELQHFLFPAIEGILALAAALTAFAFRRRTRWFTPAGFIILAVGLTLDLMTPHRAPLPVWAPYTRALGIVLLFCGLIRLAEESVEQFLRRNGIQVSAIATELTLTGLYAAVVALVSYNMLAMNVRAMIAIPTLLTLGQAALQQRDMFSGLIVQSQRPFRVGDWVQIDERIGQVQSTGWGTTRILTASGERLTIPSKVIAGGVLANYSASGCVANEVFLNLGYSEEPWMIESAIHEVLADIPEVLRDPRPEVGPWEYGDSAIRYRIRYWVNDFAHADAARGQIVRNVWYALRRQATEFPLPAGTMAMAAPKNRKDLGELIQDLRKVDLFSDLPEEDLRIIIPSVKVGQYGRGEVIIRQGAVGDSFFVLRRGTVEVLANGTEQHPPIVINHIDHHTERNYFGEIALLKGEPRNATVRAGTDVEVLEVKREGFAHLFKARPESAPAIAKIAALREEQTIARTTAVAVTSAAVREEQGIMLATMRKIFDF